MKISILGSTGSIGTQTLEVIDNLKNYSDIEVIALSGNTNIDLLYIQAIQYNVKYVAVYNKENALKLSKMAQGKFEVYAGLQGLVTCATINDATLIVNGLVGNIGLIPTFEALKGGKNVALANKETLVTAGQIIMPLAKEKNVKILPLDSEHSAIFQCIQNASNSEINKLILTASGGPFLNKPIEELKNVTVEQALAHPTWTMGAKITIDSSTMMNKGLEVIEARWLFDIDVENIDVVIHPGSVVHSFVEFCDNSILAQLGEADMRLPISYALSYPTRVKNDFKKLNLFDKQLNFYKPDYEKFRCLTLAFDAIKQGGIYPTILNMANEIAVAKFLNNEIKYLQIQELIESALNEYTYSKADNLEDILEAETWCKEFLCRY